jgi:predicted membrane-bound dolichyl-phosphate-mannose-protein mannosyltransferase
VEAFRGGRGDRFVAGSPFWILALPTLAGIYLTAVVAGALASGAPQADNLLLAAPNILLVGIYTAIGYFLVRTQIRNHRPLGGWSISGLALGVIFPTCAVMHGVFAFYTLNGRYGYDVHGFGIDWLAVPAGIYFLWVVRRLYEDTLEDWNRAAPDVMQGRVVVS